MTGLEAGAGAAGWVVDGLVAGAGWLEDGFGAGVAWAGAAVGFGAAVPPEPDDVAGAAWDPLPVARLGMTWDGPAGLPPVPTSTTFRDDR
jgi:hypothetical protein